MIQQQFFTPQERLVNRRAYAFSKKFAFKRLTSQTWEFTASDILLHAHIYHTHGLFAATNIALVSGSQIRFLKKFDVDDIILKSSLNSGNDGVPTSTRLLANDKFNKK